MSFQILPPELHSQIFTFVEPHLLSQVCRFSRKEAFRLLERELETGALQKTPVGRRWRDACWHFRDFSIEERILNVARELFEEIQEFLKWSQVGAFERPSLLDLRGMETFLTQVKLVSCFQDLRTILPKHRPLTQFFKLHSSLSKQAYAISFLFNTLPLPPLFANLPRKKCEKALLPFQNGPSSEGEYPFAPEILFRLPSLNKGSWDKFVQLAFETHQPEALLSFIESPRFRELSSFRPLFIKACERGYVDVALALLEPNRNAPLFEQDKRVLKCGIGKAIFYSNLRLIVTFLEHPLCNDRHLFHQLLLNFQDSLTRLLASKRISKEVGERLKGWAEESGLLNTAQQLHHYLLAQ